MILKFRRREILKEISLENVEVEHDFSEGLSKRVTLKFFGNPPTSSNSESHMILQLQDHMLNLLCQRG